MNQSKGRNMTNNGDIQTLVESQLIIVDLKKQLEEAQRLVIKKDGHIEALQNEIQKSQQQHFHEMKVMKDSFKIELSRVQELWMKTMNQRMDEKIEFHLEQQSEKFEAKLEELDNTTANIEYKIDDLDEKIDRAADEVRVGNEQTLAKEENLMSELTRTSEKFDSKLQDLDKSVGENRAIFGINCRYFIDKLVRFTEECSSGVTISPFGDSITCSSLEGGGACFNLGIEMNSVAKYEWIFQYDDTGVGDVYFGFCMHTKKPFSWDLNCGATCLWNPETGDRYNGARSEGCRSPTGKRKGIVRFVFDLNKTKFSKCS
eukprot:TRINITY_DN5291_c0_g1_i2.p1 TRINITY_DN5291_c0_g1~~TRINITY_DN5291_c0_g1_i2.p1  ORF type:complete len:316 (+),score=77.01 TRINITY_DN5291_c0_g1_i2:108-1055(+)